MENKTDFNEYDKILDLFKSDEKSRFNIDKPQAEDGFIFATNRHILISIPKQFCLGEYEKTSSIKFSAIIKKSLLLEKPIELEVSQINRALLEAGKQSLVEDKNCESCEGFGECECDCGHQHNCANCDGRGMVKHSFNVKFLDSFYESKYLDKILYAAQHLNNNKFSILALPTNPSKGEPLLCAIGGIFIALMPLNVSEFICQNAIEINYKND